MADELGSVIQLNTQVRRIKWTENAGVDVTYQQDGGDPVTAHFDGVIVTVPLGVLKDASIEFQPDLPAHKLASIDKMGYGNLNKVVMTFSEVFWGDTDFFGIAQPASGPRGLGYIFWNIAKATKRPVLVTLLTGRAANEADTSDSDTEIIRRIVTNLKAVFGDKVQEPLEAQVTHWSADPFARGCYSYVGVAASGEDYDVLARPVGDVLFFAGEATNRRHPSTVAGAIESGIREAARIDRLFGLSAGTEQRFAEPEFSQQVRSKHSRTPFARSGRNQDQDQDQDPEQDQDQEEDLSEFLPEASEAKRQKVEEEEEELPVTPKPAAGLLLFECDTCRLYFPSIAALQAHQESNHPALPIE